MINQLDRADPMFVFQWSSVARLIDVIAIWDREQKSGVDWSDSDASKKMESLVTHVQNGHLIRGRTKLGETK